MKLLADTGAMLALFNPRDTLHQRARKFARDAAGTRFVVTELFSARPSHGFAQEPTPSTPLTWARRS